MPVHWLEQTEADVPAHGEWLGPAEVLRLSTLRFPKRRADWRLGRWTAKHAVAVYLDLSDHVQDLANIEIRPAPCGAPEAWLENSLAPVTISLSHREGTAICAVAPSGFELGCDLEVIEARTHNFVTDYFTAEEQSFVGQTPPEDRWRVLALLWSAKESALKAMRVGLRLDTRSLSVKLSDVLLSRPYVWNPMTVLHGSREFCGWWQQTGSRLRTVIVSPQAPPPALLGNWTSGQRKAQAENLLVLQS